VAVALALALASLAAGTASAYSVVSETGAPGPYDITDAVGTPGTSCTYGQPQPPFEMAWLHSVRVLAPHVFAADRNPEVRDHRHVSWRFLLQGKVYGSADPWHVFRMTKVQHATAYDDAMAPLTAKTVSFNARTGNSHPDKSNFVFQTQIVIKWYKPNGAVEGTVKLLPDYYRIKGPFSPPFTGGGDYCGAINTSG
jgi:hypothetical protein